MGLIGAPVALMDVANVEAFVQHTIDRSRIVYSPDEREELLAEGLTILYELAGKYKPHIAGHAKPGRFSGYAAMFLPRRLGDYWHKSHPNHRYVTDRETGQRGWVYLKPMLSLDGLTSGDAGQSPDRHLHHAKTIDAFCHAATVRLPGRAS